MLKHGYRVLWTKPSSFEEEEEMRIEHCKLFHMATDLSMLKLFESLLESAPQLLLQVYIVMAHRDGSSMQCKRSRKPNPNKNHKVIIKSTTEKKKKMQFCD